MTPHAPLSVVALLTFACGCGAVQRTDGGEGMVPIGHGAPALSATDHRGQTVDLRRLDGQYALVYFYPKDGTPGCTEEACAFRDVWSRYEDAGVRVIGVSTDDGDSHRSFAKEHELPFSLIADVDGTWAKAFGVPRFLGMTSRVSFLIDDQGMIVKTYPNVDAGVHAERVLSDHRKLTRA